MSEYITLVSNVNTGQFNSIAEFNTVLSKKMHLSGEWVVGLAEISYTKSWFNVLNSHKIVLFDELGNIYDNNGLSAANKIFKGEKSLQISNGFYESPKKLIEEINNILQKLTTIQPPLVIYYELSNSVSIRVGQTKDELNVYPYLGSEIENILGLFDRDYTKNYYETDESKRSIVSALFSGTYATETHEIPAFNPIEISGGHHSLFIYSDIVYPSFLGDTCSQILRVVEIPRKSKFAEQCVIKYENPYYMPVMHNSFDSIQISIKDDNNRLIPFKFGRVIITLHFKKLK